MTSAPQTIVIQESRGSRFWSRVGWVGFILCGLLLIGQYSARHDYLDTSGGVREHLHSGRGASRNKIALIRLTGVIVHDDGYLKKQIERVQNDPHVKAVILRVDTPGGTVAGSDYFYHYLKRLRRERDLPLVVSMGSIATSGGYYVAMAAGEGDDLIFAEPTTTTGSIGVIIPHYDLSGLMDSLHVKDDSIVSHPLKQMLSVTRAPSSEERERLQSYVDQTFRRFKQVVLEARPRLRGEQPDSIRAINSERDLATGEIFTADQALEFGLVDQIGFLEDAVQRACELAAIGTDDYRIVEYQRPFEWTDLLGLPTARANRGGAPWSGSQWWEATVPRAYFLTTTVPPLIQGP